ncbi:hypothetical protein KCU91_g9417, partial [Aureobasidium melanogenum]
MTDVSSSPQDQTEQSDVQEATSCSQVSNAAGDSEQSEVKVELETACAQLLAILNKRNSAKKQTRLRSLWIDYRTAINTADLHRTAAHARGQILDVETATTVNLSHLDLVSYHEKDAVDVFQAILKIMREDRAIFAEIEEASHKALLLVDKIPYPELFTTMVQVTLDSLQRERESMESFLTQL